MKRQIIALFVAAMPFAAMAQRPAYLDPSLPAAQRADDLLSRLTLQQKASLMMASSPAIPELGIPQFDWWNEALHGVARNGTATVFPAPIGMAASFDDELLGRVFTAVSDEARAKNAVARRSGRIKRYQCLSFWTPNINIFRDPRWGRGQETYGEDPYLTTRMGLAVVRGLQGSDTTHYRKLLACAKHFAVHSGPEWSRHSFNISLDTLPQRDLWETYMPAFHALVTQGRVAEVMCAYHSMDGRPCCGNEQLLGRILRDEWGFRGIVTSDCGAVKDFWEPGAHGVAANAADASAQAVAAGTDVECGSNYRDLPKAVEQGRISEDKVNTSLRRLLIARFELGDLDPDSIVPWTRIPMTVVDCPEHRELALRMAHESIVLLQNRNNALPLTVGNAADVVVMGPNAADSVMQWGNYNGTPRRTVTVLDGLRRVLGPVRYVRGCDLVAPCAPAEIHNALLAVGNASTVVFVGGISPKVEGEEMKVDLPGFRGGDRTSIELPAVQRDLIARLHRAGKRVVLVVCAGSAVALAPEAREADAIVYAWYPGQEGGTAVADVLTGRYNPSGRLPVTLYKDDAQLPPYEDYRMEGRTYRYLNSQPLFPFGHGLSYTTFRYSKPVYKDGKLTFTLTNTGQKSGTEVAQLYVSRRFHATRPLRTLRGFVRVDLAPGESRRVSMPCPPSTFDWWDASTNTMRQLPGRYILSVGASSDPSRLVSVEVKP